MHQVVAPPSQCNLGSFQTGISEQFQCSLSAFHVTIPENFGCSEQLQPSNWPSLPVQFRVISGGDYQSNSSAVSLHFKQQFQENLERFEQLQPSNCTSLPVQLKIISGGDYQSNSSAVSLHFKQQFLENLERFEQLQLSNCSCSAGQLKIISGGDFRAIPVPFEAAISGRPWTIWATAAEQLQLLFRAITEQIQCTWSTAADERSTHLLKHDGSIFKDGLGASGCTRSICLHLFERWKSGTSDKNGRINVYRRDCVSNSTPPFLFPASVNRNKKRKANRKEKRRGRKKKDQKTKQKKKYNKEKNQ